MCHRCTFYHSYLFQCTIDSRGFIGPKAADGVVPLTEVLIRPIAIPSEPPSKLLGGGEVREWSLVTRFAGMGWVSSGQDQLYIPLAVGRFGGLGYLYQVEPQPGVPVAGSLRLSY
jgi:hypothetical protein